MNTDRSFNFKPEDRPSSPPSIAADDEQDGDYIALDVKDLGVLEGELMMANGFIGESRIAISNVLNRMGDRSTFKRDLYRSLRAQDDARKKIDEALKQARGL